MTARRSRWVTPYTVTRGDIEDLLTGERRLSWACAVALGQHDGPVSTACVVGCVQRCCDAINRRSGAR